MGGECQWRGLGSRRLGMDGMKGAVVTLRPWVQPGDPDPRQVSRPRGSG